MNFLDQVPLLTLLALLVLGQVMFIEIGFRYGKTVTGKGVKAQMAQVRAIMGASLGLLAFMLAFSFSMAQQHFEVRTQAYMMEVGAIDSAFRGADLIGQERRIQPRSCCGTSPSCGWSLPGPPRQQTWTPW